MTRTSMKAAAVGLFAYAAMCAAALACGAPPPQTPPPPPPAPPIVCCVVIARQVDPDDDNFECLIVRYFRQDGGPLYQSNPMPLPPTQQCLCAVPPLPSEAIAAGAVVTELTFGARPIWQGVPPNVPGYLPFTPLPQSGPLTAQTAQFFLRYAQVAGDVKPPDSGPVQAWVFGGPGQILPGLFFDIYQKIRVPRGFNPDLLCVPGQMWMIGLFLVDNGTVLSEPLAPGLPPVPFQQFSQNPGQSAFYKFKWYPNIVPPPCPPCPGDENGDFTVNFFDLNRVLSFFGRTCPPPPPAD